MHLPILIVSLLKLETKVKVTRSFEKLPSSIFFGMTEKSLKLVSVVRSCFMHVETFINFFYQDT